MYFVSWKAVIVLLLLFTFAGILTGWQVNPYTAGQEQALNERESEIATLKRQIAKLQSQISENDSTSHAQERQAAVQHQQDIDKLKAQIAQLKEQVKAADNSGKIANAVTEAYRKGQAEAENRVKKETVRSPVQVLQNAKTEPDSPPTVPLTPLVQTRQLPESPDFDCGKASTFVEKEICKNPTLARLDAELGRVYRLAQSKRPDFAGNLRKDQRAWWSNRDAILESQCKKGGHIDAECARHYWENRIAEIQSQL